MQNEMTPLEAAEILERPCGYSYGKIGMARQCAASYLRKIASGEYAPMVHAHWIKRPFPHIGGELRCSRCNGIFSAELYRNVL